ncbi:hypothetical protein HanRHA438_Chr05g0218351 [Helianthus annuus]|nr:hypothetical protein HanPI659440_Chr02g0047781 [Helianthus annuus]KAJ0918476.1 hypothetical protein HanRHA438_Chr05g0218351 [Helianthus annuus]
MLLRFRWWFRRNGWGIIGLLGCLMRSWRLGILNWWHPSDLSQI